MTFLKIEYDESNGDLSPAELIVYSWIKAWCLNHHGRCPKTYSEILKLLPNCKISEGTLKRAVWTLIEKGKLKRENRKQSPVLYLPNDVFSKDQNDLLTDQNDLLEQKSKDQIDPTKDQNDPTQKINLIRPKDQNDLSHSINRSLIDLNIDHGKICVQPGSKILAAEPTHTAPLSQHCKIPDAETIASQFIANNPELIRDVAITEATKFRNYYLSHPNKWPENNFWKGLISNWQINDRDKLFAKNSLNSGEKRQETDYSEQFKNVNHAAIAQWLNLGGVCKN